MKKFLLVMVVALFASTFGFAQSREEYRKAFGDVCRQVTAQNCPLKTGNVTIQGMYYKPGVLTIRATVNEYKTSLDKEFKKTIDDIQYTILGGGPEVGNGGLFYQLIVVTESNIEIVLKGNRTKKVRKHVITYQQIGEMFQY